MAHQPPAERDSQPVPEDNGVRLTMDRNLAKYLILAVLAAAVVLTAFWYVSSTNARMDKIEANARILSVNASQQSVRMDTIETNQQGDIKKILQFMQSYNNAIGSLSQTDPNRDLAWNRTMQLLAQSPEDQKRANQTNACFSQYQNLIYIFDLDVEGTRIVGNTVNFYESKYMTKIGYAKYNENVFDFDIYNCGKIYYDTSTDRLDTSVVAG